MVPKRSQERHEAKEQRKKQQRRLREQNKEFKKDGFTQQERESLNKLDNAYVEMTLQLGKF